MLYNKSIYWYSLFVNVHGVYMEIIVCYWKMYLLVAHIYCNFLLVIFYDLAFWLLKKMRQNPYNLRNDSIFLYHNNILLSIGGGVGEIRHSL